MKIVYLPEWGEKIDDAKHKILTKFGDDVWFPKVNYIAERNIIYNYSNEIQKHGTPTLIVGSLLGGYMAYHISNIVRFPALLFNPTFFYKNGGEVRREDGMGQCHDKNIIFSLKNEDIDIKRTVKFLEEFGYKDIKFYDGISQIPLDIFENEFSAFREKHKNIKGNRNEKKSSLDYASKVGIKKDRYDPFADGLLEDIPDIGDAPEPEIGRVVTLGSMPEPCEFQHADMPFVRAVRNRQENHG